MCREAWKDEKWTCLHFSFFPCKQCRETPTYFSNQKKKASQIKILQKLGCQKPCWDHARLSSLENKQVCCEDALYDRGADSFDGDDNERHNDNLDGVHEDSGDDVHDDSVGEPKYFSVGGIVVSKLGNAQILGFCQKFG